MPIASSVLADLNLPPGCRIRIDYDPNQWAPNVTITVFRGEHWIGEVTGSVTRLSEPGELQQAIDSLTKRGVQLMKSEARPDATDDELLAAMRRVPPPGWRE
jgi:hypothetical protein